MKIANIRQKSFGFPLNCLKLNKNSLLSSLLIVLIGIFLLPKVALTSAITPEKIIELTNIHRTETNLSLLARNERLMQAALNKARSIFEKQNFEHKISGKKFSAWVREAGYEYSYIGENLAIDFITSEGIMMAWLASEEHRENLLSPNYKEIGVAVLESGFQGQNTILVVQIFGAKLKPLVPDEILQKEERLGPGGEVLAANENFLEAKKLKQKTYLEKAFSFLGKKKSTFAVEILIFISSILFVLALTYLYLLGLVSLIKFVFTRKLE